MSTPPPSSLSLAVATFILGALSGYFLSQGSSLGLFSSSSSPTASSSPTKKSWPNSYDVTLHPDSSDEELMKSLHPPKQQSNNPPAATSPSSPEESDSDSDSDSSPSTPLNPFSSSREELKLVLIVRTDLGMSKGKIAAQCSHATLSNYTSLLASSPSLLKRWAAHGQPKIALQVGSYDEMVALQGKAQGVGLCARVVRDAGRTQIKAGEVTVLGVGPGPRSVVDGVSGGLKLL